MFGIFNGLALRGKEGLENESSRPALLFTRVPVVAFWVWINLLPFAIDNQRQDVAILEDKHNKPWRTMPSGRMTPTHAKTLMCILYPAAFFASLYLGGLRQCSALMVLGYLYNDLRLADWSWISRNAINALGFCCFASGALEVTLKAPLQVMPLPTEYRRVIEWLGIIAAVVFSTVQTQDMADQEGDLKRNRKSMPLAVGDGAARCFTAVMMSFWTVVCPLYWMVGNGTSLVVWVLGFGIACRTLVFRSLVADKSTFRLWNVWMAALYALPLLAPV